MSDLQPKAAGPVDLAVLLMSTDPRLVREAYAVAEGARERGFAVRVVELDAASSDELVLSSLAELDPAVTALGAEASTFNRCIGAAKALQQRERPVLLFGRLFNDELERRKVPVEAATGIVVGPARPTVLDFMRSLNGSATPPVAGLDRLDGDYRPRPPRDAVEGLAFPRFHEADLQRLRREGLPIRMGYGCPRRCAFCGEQPREGSHRVRTADAIVDEIAHHCAQNVRRFHFCDLVINGDLRLLESVCDLILERKLEVSWWGRALIDGEMERSLYRKLRLAGCVGLEFEVISGSDRVLERVGAGFTADQATAAVRASAAAGIDTRVSLVVGLPGEAEIEFAETCAWLLKNRYYVSQITDLQPCELQPGSLLLEQHTAYEVTLPHEAPTLNWHDGGFNTAAYRIKRTRELRVFVEDNLHLEVVGRSIQVPWDQELRGQVAQRLRADCELADMATGRFRREHLEISGVARGAEALQGPSSLEIDLTNNCNQHCAGCWVHSYMMEEKRLTGAKRKATLEYDRLEELVLSAKRMGARRIQLSGAGEPFMHPRIDEILKLIKDAGIELNVITNFTLVDEERARRLVDLGVDSITISLWAGTASTYLKTHPTAKESLFDQVVDTVSHLTWYRRHTGARFPRVKIYNVISNLNCHEIHEMIDRSREMGADLIEFTPVDILEGYTDALALSEEDSQAVMEQLMTLRQRPDYLQRTEEEVLEGRLPGLEEQGEYARFLQRQRLPGDFRFSLGDIRAWEAFCRRGVHCNRVYEEIHRDSAIFFGFPACECEGCLAATDCSIDPMTLNVRAPYLSLQGFGSFWRRIKGGSGEGLDAKVVDRVPCAIGYTYARVQATGHVIPCCKAADFPLGNILEERFEDLWSSERYEEFRQRALTELKSDPYFAPMECYKVCDNLGHNMETDETLRGLSPQALRELERED
jgi:MoaA/NifB/PqqE/SkfB family radical SAM enzyme/radical SAM superfamily enzyme YgiQ (UPF0313 family)